MLKRKMIRNIYSPNGSHSSIFVNIEMTKLSDLYKDIRSFIPSKVDLGILDDLEEEIVHLTLNCYKQLIILDEHVIKDGNSTEQTRNTMDEISSAARIVLDKTWEDLNTGHWSQVPESKRYIYSLGSLILTVMRVMQAAFASNSQEIEFLEKGLRDSDMGLLLGCAFRLELTKIARTLSDYIVANDSSRNSSRTSLICGNLLPAFHGVRGDDICTSRCPSLETFSANFFTKRKPVKLTDCMSHWPALNRWNNLDYLSEKAGGRTVPVEIGSRYDAEEWSQSLMTVKEFIKTYIEGSDEPTKRGYLAQHQLFNQIPELLADICEPEYCCCSEEDDVDSNATDINAWFGPAGTVSPLHYDPKHNILAQVVGRKRILLYDPKYSDRLSSHDSKLLSNTAQVDPENPDYKLFPDYKNVPVLETILSPGEMLYIPPTWWHHVRSLDVSFSVSFWWE